MVMGEMDVARANPYRSDTGESQCTWPCPHPTGQRRSSDYGVGSGSRSASYPMDNAHQDRIISGAGG